MSTPLLLSALIKVVDRAFDPQAATRNARHAAADLSEHRRQLDEAERVLRPLEHATTAQGAGPIRGGPGR